MRTKRDFSDRRIERLALEDTLFDAIYKLSDGNPGAITVMALLMKTGDAVDAQCSPFMYLCYLDAFGIYGPDIWILYKDLCDESVPRFMACLRAVQLGVTSEQTLRDAIASGRGQVVASVDELLSSVRTRLGTFARR